MFWHAVWSGFLALFDWHILVGLAGMSLLTVAYYIIEGMLEYENGPKSWSNAAIALDILGKPLVVLTPLTAIMTLCISPILGIGNGGFTPVHLIPTVLFIVMLTLMYTYIPMALCNLFFIQMNDPNIPYVRNAKQYTIGIIILQLQIHHLFVPLNKVHVLRSLPSVWCSLGFIIVGTVISLALIMLIGPVVKYVSRDTKLSAWCLKYTQIPVI